MAETVVVDRAAVRSRPLPIIVAMGMCAIVSHTLARSTFPLLLPAIESELLDNRQTSGLLGSVNFTGYLAGVVLVTLISGLVEPVRLLTAGLAVAAVGFGFLAGADGVAQLSIGQALTGLGSAGIWMSAPTIATGAAGPSRSGTAMGFLSSSMGLGLLVTGQGTNLIRSVTNDSQSWRPTWWAAAGFAGIVLAMIATMLRLPRTAPVGGGISLARLRTVPRWPVLCASYWLFGLAAASFPAFFGLLLKDQGFSPGHITNLFSLLGLAATLSAVTLGRVSDRIGRRPVLAAAMAVIGMAAVLGLIGREPFSAIAMIGLGGASFTFPVLVAAYLRDHLEDRAFSNALGALTIVYGTALIVGPTLAGTVADSRLGLEVVFLGIAAVAFVSAGAASGLSGRSRSPEPRESSAPTGSPEPAESSAPTGSKEPAESSAPTGSPEPTEPADSSEPTGRARS